MTKQAQDSSWLPQVSIPGVEFPSLCGLTVRTWYQNLTWSSFVPSGPVVACLQDGCHQFSFPVGPYHLPTEKRSLDFYSFKCGADLGHFLNSKTEQR